MDRFIFRLLRACLPGTCVTVCALLCFCAGTAQALTVTTIAPKGAVRDLTQITVRFSGNMTPLGSMTVKNAPLRLSASGGKLPAGTFRWLDPATLAYVFDQPVMRPLTIHASVPKGTASLDGETLGQDVAWKVSTPPLALSLDNPPEAGLPRKGAILSVVANYPLRERLLKEKSRLTVNGKKLAFTLGKSEKATPRQGGSATWRYTYKIAGNLPGNSTVVLGIASGLTAKDGGDPAPEISFIIPTYGDLRLKQWLIDGYGPEKRERDPRPENLLYLHFNNPVRLADLVRHVSVTPEAAAPEMDAYLDSRLEGESFSLPYRWKPRTKYTVTIRPGLMDRHGTALKQQEKFTFTTGDYHPFIFMPEGSFVLEPALADRFPLIARNAGMVMAKLRYLPWGRDAFRLLRQDAATDTDAFREYAGARESVLAVDTGSNPNTLVRKDLDILNVLEFPPDEKPGGFITVCLVPPEGDVEDVLKPFYSHSGFKAGLQITDLGIAARLGEKRGFAWVVGITSGKPAADAVVRLLDKDGHFLWRGRTDSAGLAVFPGFSAFSAMPRFCIAEKDNDSVALDLAAAGLPDSKEEYGQQVKQYENWAVHALTQLPLYQPGQTVNAVLYARRHTDKQGSMEYADWLPLAGETLDVAVLDRNNKTVHGFEATTNAYGSLPFSFTLAADAEPGWHTVRAVRKDTGSRSSTHPFQVASFRPPDFRVDVTPPPSEPLPAEKPVRLRAGVTASYFSGALLPGAAVTMTGEYRESHFKPARLANYTTGPGSSLHAGNHGRPYLDSASVAGKLDENGEAVLTLPPVPESLFPLDLSLTATVTDAANLTSQGTASCLLHPSAWYVGLRSSFIVQRDADAEIMLKGATWDNKPLAGKPVSLNAERVTWENGKETAKPVWEKTHILADETGDRVSVSFAESGSYRLTAGILDDDGRKNVAVARIYVPGPGLVWPAAQRGSRLDLLVEEDRTYQSGDTARLVIKNPFNKGWILVALERNGVRRTLVREISGTDPVIEVPLEETDAPYVHAAVSLVTGRAAPPPTSVSLTGINPEESAPEKAAGNGINAARDDGRPVLYQGGALLRLRSPEPGLSVTVTTDAGEYRPGDTVWATAAVTEGGKGKKAQITFLAVDERVLRAAGERTAYDPRQTFRPLYQNRVHTADIWRLLLDIGRIGMHAVMPRSAAQMATPMGVMAQEAWLGMNTASGEFHSAPLVRHNFSPLVFWLPEGETGEDGVLKVSFTLPDTLTSYRVVAVAADRKGGFAGGQTSVRAAKSLQLLPVLPKFVTEGDRFEAGVLVQNTGSARGEATVSLAVSGNVNDEGPRRKSVILDAGRSSLVTFPLDAAMLPVPSGEIRLRAEADMDGDTDAAEFILPIKPSRPVTTVAAAGMLAEGDEYTLPVKAPANLDPRSRMDVTFAPSPAAGIPLAAKQVIEYPWNCLEQRLSRAWARMIRLEYGDFIGLFPDAGDKEAVDGEFKAILSHQREDGSFALWPGMTGPDDSGVNLFITAYALLVLNEGRDLDFFPPDAVWDKALNYIQEKLQVLLEARAAKDALAPENLALALHVLAQHRPSVAEPLFPPALARCERDGANPFGWGALLLTLDALEIPDRADSVSRILANLERSAAITPGHLHFASSFNDRYWLTLGSRLRDNAMVLAALATVQPDYPRLEALAAWTGQRVGDTKILNTQEAAFGLWGLVKYLRSLGGDRETVIRAVWNGRNKASASFGKLMDPPTSWTIPAHALNGGNGSNLVLRADAGRPYWTVRLVYASPDLPVKTENAGFTLTRSFSSKGPWKVGDIVNVTVTVTVPATRHHVLLFDPFPAGFEPLHASRVDLMDWERRENAGYRHGPWQWLDALDDGMLFYASVMPPGTYAYTYSLRAAIAGTFTRRPSFVEEMYTPEVFGRTEAAIVTIVGK